MGKLARISSAQSQTVCRGPRGVGISAWSPPRGAAGCNKVVEASASSIIMACFAFLGFHADARPAPRAGQTAVEAHSGGGLQGHGGIRAYQRRRPAGRKDRRRSSGATAQ